MVLFEPARTLNTGAYRMSERFKSPSGSEIKVVERMRVCLRLPLILNVVSVYFAAQVASGSEPTSEIPNLSVDLSGDDPRHPQGCKDP